MHDHTSPRKRLLRTVQLTNRYAGKTNKGKKKTVRAFSNNTNFERGRGRLPHSHPHAPPFAIVYRTSRGAYAYTRTVQRVPPPQTTSAIDTAGRLRRVTRARPRGEPPPMPRVVDRRRRAVLTRQKNSGPAKIIMVKKPSERCVYIYINTI